ncbi:MAG: DinB family protein [Acidobacteriota bacterium]
MSISQAFIGELEQEAHATRKLFAAVPDDKLGWRPHEKSMTLGKLCSHIALLPNWSKVMVEGDGLNFAEPMEPEPVAASSEELLAMFENAMETCRQCLEGKSDQDLMATWTMSRGDEVISQMPKVAVTRAWLCNHLYHHRGQLTVYLRMLDVPLPQVYGPTADDPSF